MARIEPFYCQSFSVAKSQAWQYQVIQDKGASRNQAVLKGGGQKNSRKNHAHLYE